MLFVHPGTVEAAEAVFDTFWPEARAVSDPDKALYGAFDLGKGNLFQLLGPGVWRRAFQARSKGYAQSGSGGDAALMPGTFLIENATVVRMHDHRHAGDRPDYEALTETAARP